MFEHLKKSTKSKIIPTFDTQTKMQTGHASGVSVEKQVFGSGQDYSWDPSRGKD